MISIGLRILGLGRSNGAAPVFSFFKTITIDHTKVPSGQTDFPVLVQGTYAYLKTVGNGGDVQNLNGYDIVFATDNAGVGRLAFQIESYNAATGDVNFWVKIPSVSSSVDTVFYMVFGCATISASQEDAPGTWSNGFIAVQHLNGNSNDASGNGNNGTDTSVTYASELIAEGAVFNGSTSLIDLGTLTAEDTVGFSFSCWVKASSWAHAYNAVNSKEAIGTSGRTLLVKSSGKLAIYMDTAAGQGNQHVNYDGSGSNTLGTGTWYLLAYTYDGSGSTTIKGYVNGVQDGSATGTGSSSLAGTGAANGHESIGASFSISGRVLTAVMDEVHISTSVRSADWLLAEFNNQNSPSTFYSVT